MEQSYTQLPEMTFETRFSFLPLYREMQNIIQAGKNGRLEYYRQILEKGMNHPVLGCSIEDSTVLEEHQDLVDEIMSILFPVTLSFKKDYYSVSLPLSYRIVYASEPFSETFLDPDTKEVRLPDNQVGQKLRVEKICGAYQLILEHLYKKNLGSEFSSVHPFTCPHTGLQRFMELKIDARFVDVSCSHPLPEIPSWIQINRYKDIFWYLDTLLKLLPPEWFRFEGFCIAEIEEITEREVISKIKNQLLDPHLFDDYGHFIKLQDEMENLVGLPGVRIGITPLFRLNDQVVFNESHYTGSIFFNCIKNIPERNRLCSEFQHYFENNPEFLVLPEISEYAIQQFSCLNHVKSDGWKSIIVCPLRNNDLLTGLLEIVSKEAGVLNYDYVGKIEPAIPLFELAMEKLSEKLESQIDKIIKDKFTAIQPAVEWRFTQAAINYITSNSEKKAHAIEPIVFEDVYPLYGAIDIRNSSVERNNAIQLDLLEQLNIADEIVRKARMSARFPLLDEIRFKLDRYADSVANVLFSDEEVSIQKFLRNEITQLFIHLKSLNPALEKDIDGYLEAVNSPVNMLYHHRREYEESITKINERLARFIDQEQAAAQQIYPHYFERFVTDGVDFNMYIGQSIIPSRPFDIFYLKNLKIWQLTTLIGAARLTRQLEKEMALPLQTTQLILAHSQPLSISFRSAERKFDVDGAYNIRYEIIKKRIDKVRLRDINERLTQPGMLAIVYSQPEEAAEYKEYIDYLKDTGLLKGDMQHFDLEEMQGVTGLKGLRVAIQFEEEESSPESGKKSIDQLLSRL